MNIGQAAKASGVSAKMIRYYEQSGLIPPADRRASGYRDYSDTDVHNLSFIRRARDLGFSVAEIGDLLGLWRDQDRQSVEVRKLALSHIETLEKKIVALQEMSRTLGALVACCNGDERPDCPIIDSLQSGREGEDVEIRARVGAVEKLAR
ncbi:Cu(I)-responsive transcriptional regulator [Paracoccus sulfuroxidans]|uniref:MerR family gold-responsive transcriptional activator of gol and ges genes n=1 Tax=Paracoccus sulfuroxidans TaxID=384678 RepID=A0A562NMB3_9RHOB|nr:Cu(I)-responsive transcriptional regulator [Paracoccus sulfuroxidans]TWI33210.1 MerR family gold-responsive transcriptional activator of gol and ges genes [Paracoccus sulfuroxidans]